MTSEGAREFAASSLLFEPSAGVFGVLSPLRRLRLTAGATLGVHSVVRASYTASVGCGEDADCESGIADASDPFTAVAHVTGFASAAWLAGPLTLYAQVAVNSSGDSPFGATGGVRITP
jgi:hypothetical protein